MGINVFNAGRFKFDNKKLDKYSEREILTK